MVNMMEGIRHQLRSRRGHFVVWYLLAAVGGIAVFYVIFFLFWAQIKGWFIHGS